MSQKFNAVMAADKAGKTAVEITQLSIDDLPDLDVLVDIEYSTLNYKDALAVSGKSKICRRLPMVCGIDLAGVVAESRADRWTKGDRVIVNGYGLSETEWGGYAQRQRVSSDWLVRQPDKFTSQQAMAIGTAGYTSMLCVNALRDHGLKPADGSVVVTGASGGVGSIALHLLTALGYSAVAVSGSESSHDFLRSLGAEQILDRAELDRQAKPLEKELWAGGIDSVGSKTLATLIAQTRYGGVIAACGLAGGFDLPATVMPFILRAVTLRGVDSVMAIQSDRQRAWDDLAEIIDLSTLQSIYEVKPMSEICALADDLFAGNLQGRVVIDVNA